MFSGELIHNQGNFFFFLGGGGGKRETSEPNQVLVKPMIYINHFPNKPVSIYVSGRNLLKTQWEKEKSLVTLYFTILTFNDHEDCGFWKHCE